MIFDTVSGETVLRMLKKKVRSSCLPFGTLSGRYLLSSGISLYLFQRSFTLSSASKGTLMGLIYSNLKVPLVPLRIFLRKSLLKLE